MTLREALTTWNATAAVTPDRNLSLLRSRLEQGYAVASASLLPAGLGPMLGPVALLQLARGNEEESVPVCLGERSVELLGSRCGDATVSDDGGLSDPRARAASASALSRRLGDLFKSSESLPPEERARILADWIMSETDASRCALIPFAGDSPGLPLAFPRRGVSARELDARAVPRRIIAEVARTRATLVIDDVATSSRFVEPSESTVRQQVGSFLAAPVVFRGELIAVCYVDRIGQRGSFSEAAVSVFQALAYELARPLMSLRDEQRAREYRSLRDGLLAGGKTALPVISGRALAPVLAQARQLAPFAELNLLVLGETGVGKEVVARFIHEASGRHGKFVAVNVGALPTELFESELMGSVRGAFTGASDRPGRMALADRGTLFLDEIGDLSLINQVKLLRLIDDKCVTPIGGRSEQRLDVRVIAASNRPIEQMVGGGEFRADLLHRFAPPLRVPPLRSRRDEILPHAFAWLEAKSRSLGVARSALTAAAQSLLEDYPWPGNVRQLEMVLSHAIAICPSGRIDAVDLRAILDDRAPESTTRSHIATWDDWRALTERQEREWLTSVLAAEGGNANAAARRVSCPGTTFRRLLGKHKLLPDAGPGEGSVG